MYSVPDNSSESRPRRTGRVPLLTSCNAKTTYHQGQSPSCCMVGHVCIACASLPACGHVPQPAEGIAVQRPQLQLCRISSAGTPPETWQQIRTMITGNQKAAAVCTCCKTGAISSLGTPSPTVAIPNNAQATRTKG